ncbi:MAG: ABC transporter permease, partial [Pseudomonadota bacterium]|nr:ABC transporter permease [Pseudomonadota bacterium]
MGTTLTIALRYLTARREGAGLSLVPLLSGLGIMIGVATLVVVMAVFEGYRTAVLDRLLAQTGHLVITKPGFRSFDPAPAQAVVAAQTGVARSQPVLITQGLVLRGEKGAGVVVQAMELSDMRADPVLAEAAEKFDALSPFGTPEDAANTASGLSTVVLGAGLAAELGLS